ncbi:phage tail protein [Izhakiella australiensis]|uniref:Phage tail protein n=1 Tax=Izhakiella australiensis TaxID=1926881 RepID=A0A1S8Y6Z9_9GAMM|nr:putative phage tail protein [Izhakiella australiensis]OON34626.1 phage tail protein [Izhakiella australiensis]
MSRYSEHEYASALGKLLPRGKAWLCEPGSVKGNVLLGLAKSFAASDTAALSLLRNAFPATAGSLLTDWEQALGLPDDCSIGEMTTIALRRAAVVTKLTSSGSLSVTSLINALARSGYTITVTEFRRARCGLSACGNALNGDDWPLVLQVNVPETTIQRAKCGQAHCGDPLRTWGNKTLECILRRLVAPDIILRINYIPTPS